jgi:phosphopantothenoylcysteine decarboxylase
MCTLIISYNPESNNPLIIGANRDENPIRPSKPWDNRNFEKVTIYSPIDVLGGTWIGLNKMGIFASITNWDLNLNLHNKKTRGEVVLETLKCSNASEIISYWNTLKAPDYKPFNIYAAAIKHWKLYEALSRIGETKCIITDKANYFINTENSQSKYLANTFSDEKEWAWTKIGDPIIHIDLKDWADVFVIAPLSANTLAKMVNGLCDNLLTSVYRAWPISKRLVIAPAMNTDMWEHPITAEHIEILKNRHGNMLDVVGPITKMLACGVYGIGAMANINDIVDVVEGKKK